jgi:hypothetical protein
MRTHLIVLALAAAPVVASGRQSTTAGFTNTARRADPAVAVLMALPMFGLGHVYAGESLRGAGIFASGALGTVLLVYGNQHRPTRSTWSGSSSG